MNKDTRIHLVEELLKYPQSPLRDVIIEEAKAGEFHDYKNNKYACGKVAAVEMLRSIGAFELADRVMNGEFDEEPDEEDKAEMRKLLPENVWRAFGL